VVEVLYGLEISTGPQTYRLLLFHPPTREGRVEEIPLEPIESIVDVEPGPRGRIPEIVDE
jgi:hypothetical protein